MSRIGNNPIILPESVTLTCDDGIVIVKGKLGELTQKIESNYITVSVIDQTVNISRTSDLPAVKSSHGLYRSLIANMVKGVSEGFTKKLELRGVGYRAVTQGNILDISIGYSHNIMFDIVSDIKITAETEKGKPPVVTISGCDKQLVGAVAARIRSERKPEPYKGKGIRYVDEYVRKKAGKTAAS